MRLRDGRETILLISPQPWDGFKVSKHHYAMELADLGNDVVFLDPPETTGRFRGIDVSKVERVTGSIQRVRYRTWFPYNLKFHSRIFYDIGMRIQANRILKRIGKQYTVVWDFDPSYQFNDLNWFRARSKIFHPVDQVTEGRSETKSADVLLSVAESIAERFRESTIPKLVIPHGLCSQYEAYGRSVISRVEGRASIPIGSSGRFRVGYAGNLLAKAIDRPVFIEIMLNHPDIEFELFGPFESLDGQPESATHWISRLKDLPNVRLHGLVTPQRILEMAPMIDLWLVCYDVGLDHNGGANSHKILEYLATGSPVVSNRILAYTDTNFIQMPASSSNTDLPLIFRNTVLDRHLWDTQQRVDRIRFALKNTYRHHIETIEVFLKKNMTVVEVN
ncbi:MAG: glycosyltransferase family 4 protein [Planctomycetes bacterium]|nr:glycosyltransferase family 4 protein [Planctomycetota bacterium]